MRIPIRWCYFFCFPIHFISCVLRSKVPAPLNLNLIWTFRLYKHTITILCNMQWSQYFGLLYIIRTNVCHQKQINSSSLWSVIVFLFSSANVKISINLQQTPSNDFVLCLVWLNMLVDVINSICVGGAVLLALAFE